jgi:peptidyl-prolyl cis-trans isomerase-like 4
LLFFSPPFFVCFQEEIAAKEAKSRADVLVMVGDIHDADSKPPDDVLFICKLHPVTQEDDLEIIFGRFGPLKKVEIIRDRRSNESLGYGFVHFETKEACVAAYTKVLQRNFVVFFLFVFDNC